MYNIFIASRSFSKFSEEPLEYLKENGCIIDWNEQDRPFQEDDLIKIISKYNGIIVGVDKVTKKVIQYGKKLKVIAKNGIGVDNIDVDAASQAGIYVINAPGTNSNSVADLVLALMLALSRKLIIIDQVTKSGMWKRKIGHELWEKKVGIIGTGRIGQGVAKRVMGFNCDILAYDIQEDKNFAKKYKIKYYDLDYVLKNADYVTLHIPFNKNTKDLISTREFKLMKNSSFLINAARGGIINEEALYEALKGGLIAGAACDVFLEEPPQESPLFELDNFIATSHIGAYTYESNYNTGITIAKDLINVLKGNKPINFVNKIYR